MRIETLARCVSHEIFDVADDEKWLDFASAVVALASCRGSGLHCIGLDSFDEFVLQPVQIVRWFDDDPARPIGAGQAVVRPLVRLDAGRTAALCGESMP